MWHWATLHPYLFTILGVATPLTTGFVVLLGMAGARDIIKARRSSKNIFESILEMSRYADEKKKEREDASR